jgi:hydroxymethylpyrimidine pyrophosphatase-like HAD family hydrolase
VLIEFPDEVLFEGESIHRRIMDQLSAAGVGEIPRGSFVSEVPPGKMVLIGDETALKEAETSLAEFDSNLEYARSLPNFLDITSNAVNKGHALRVLAQSESIQPERIVAVGDGWNDRSMFEAAGFSIAMGNSHQRLKEHADLVAPPADEKGFIWVLDYVLSELNRDARSG